MRQPIIVLATAITLCTFFSCKKDESKAPTGSVEVTFENKANGKTLVLDSQYYVNAAGNPYNVSILKYYITNFTLIRSDSVAVNFKNYDLIDAANPASKSFTLDSVVNGDYVAAKFFVGVDFDRNHTGTQDGDLDPAYGMIWTWKTGYMFLKHEGNYKDAAGVSHTMAFHYGTDMALTSVTVPLQKLTVEGNKRKLQLRFDLDSAYGSANKIDFNVDNNRMSTDANDIFWIRNMGQNLSRSFIFEKAE